MTDEKHAEEGLEDAPVTADPPFGDEPDPHADDPDEDEGPEGTPG